MSIFQCGSSCDYVLYNQKKYVNSDIWNEVDRGKISVLHMTSGLEQWILLDGQINLLNN